MIEAGTEPEGTLLVSGELSSKGHLARFEVKVADGKGGVIFGAEAEVISNLAWDPNSQFERTETKISIGGIMPHGADLARWRAAALVVAAELADSLDFQREEAKDRLRPQDAETYLAYAFDQTTAGNALEVGWIGPDDQSAVVEKQRWPFEVRLVHDAPPPII